MNKNERLEKVLTQLENIQIILDYVDLNLDELFPQRIGCRRGETGDLLLATRRATGLLTHKVKLYGEIQISEEIKGELF